jgi:hypothetical protein
VKNPILRNVLVAASLALLCLGLATCEKSCDFFGGARPVDAKKPVASPKPAAPRSKWVGKWVTQSGATSYVIESEKNGSLYGYIPRGSGKEKVVMKIVNASTVRYTTPVGVAVTFRLSGGNQLTVSSLGVGAKVLKIVK